jgi:hypothetical protein
MIVTIIELPIAVVVILDAMAVVDRTVVNVTEILGYQTF